MMNWSLFPPATREVQLDEKWAFVQKKQKHCDPNDPADAKRGDDWDHVAFDPVHRLVVSVIPGKRTAENVEALVKDFKARTGDRMMDLITTDDYSGYEAAILNAYGQRITPPATGKPGRPRGARMTPPQDLLYATVHKTRRKGRVVKWELRLVFGREEDLRAALAASPVSTRINTAFIERHNGTDRNRNGRKVRKTYCFSKDWDMHEAVTYFTMYSYNFCWPVRTLRLRGSDGRWHPRTPAMAAGLTEHVWPLEEWLHFPAVQSK